METVGTRASLVMGYNGILTIPHIKPELLLLGMGSIVVSTPLE